MDRNIDNIDWPSHASHASVEEVKQSDEGGGSTLNQSDSKGAMKRTKDGKIVDLNSSDVSDGSNKKPKRRLRFPTFRRAKLQKGLFGPKYQMFKKEMDRRFEETYSAKLQLHKDDMLKRKEEKIERMQMQAQEKSQQLNMVYLNGNSTSQHQLLIFEHFPPHQVFVSSIS